MTTTATPVADPFTASHEAIAEQLEPFCDGDLDRFSDHEMLDAYDLATTWSDELRTAEIARLHIAAEWLVRHGRNLPRFGSDLTSDRPAALAGQFGDDFWDLDATL
jgi:hypothetical protein